MDIKHGTLICKIMMSPTDIDTEDISNTFFDIILCVSNMRYFNAQQLTVDQ